MKRLTLQLQSINKHTKVVIKSFLSAQYITLSLSLTVTKKNSL